MSAKDFSVVWAEAAGNTQNIAARTREVFPKRRREGMFFINAESL
jgi:hypothetical protein